MVLQWILMYRAQYQVFVFTTLRYIQLHLLTYLLTFGPGLRDAL